MIFKDQTSSRSTMNQIEVESKMVDTNSCVETARVDANRCRRLSTNGNSQRGCAVTGFVAWKTVCMCAGALVSGMQIPLIGDTVVQQEYLFHTSISTISTTFVVYSVGFLVGTVLCGFIYERVNHELSFAVALLISGISTALAPFAGAYGGGIITFVATLVAQEIGIGYFLTGVQSYVLELWKGNRFCDPMMQAVNAMCSVGATASPLIIGLFLVAPPTSFTATTEIPFVDNVSKRENDGNISSRRVATQENTAVADGFDEVYEVCFAYVSIGVLILVPGLLYLFAYCHYRKDRSRKADIPMESAPLKKRRCSVVLPSDEEEAELLENSAEQSANDVLQYHRVSNVIFKIMIVCFYIFFFYVEIMPLYLLAPFAVKYLKFSVYTASNLLAVFSGCQVLGRLVGVPLAAVIRPFSMLLINLIVTAFSCVILVAFIDIWPPIIWPTIVVAGWGMSTTFAASLLWIAETVKFTGRISSFVFTGYSMGSIFGPPFVGRLFETSTPMCFIYIVVGASIGHVILFVVIWAFTAILSRNARKTEPNDSSSVAK